MNDVPEELKQILRRLVWCMVSHEQLKDPAIQARYGLAPASADVWQMEHAEADLRERLVGALYPRICASSQLAGSIVHTGILNSPDPEMAEALDASDLGSLFVIASFAIVVELVDAGLLVPHFMEVHRG